MYQTSYLPTPAPSLSLFDRLLKEKKKKRKKKLFY